VRRAARVDANQGEIVKALRQIGCTVTPLHRVGQGVSDLLVSFRQRWVVLECKAKSKDDLTPDQVKWIGLQRAPVFIATSPLEAVTLLQSIAP
jgi:hypothetical protein